jgi:hypothetical protein
MWKVGLFVLTIAVALGLGSTVLRNPLAEAASPFTNVIVGNNSANPVPVAVQNVDANGNLKVHEQGTADTRVTAYPQATKVHVHGGDLDSANSFEIDDDFGAINASTIRLSNLADGCQVIFQVVNPNGLVMFEVVVPATQTVTIPLPETVAVSKVIAGSGAAFCEAEWTIVGS